MRTAALGADWWRYTATALAGVLLTMGAAWFGGAREWVTRSEATEMIRDLSPYTQDRSAIQQALAQQSDALKTIQADVKEISRRQAEMLGAVRQLGSHEDRK